MHEDMVHILIEAANPIMHSVPQLRSTLGDRNLEGCHSLLKGILKEAQTSVAAVKDKKACYDVGIRLMMLLLLSFSSSFMSNCNKTFITAGPEVLRRARDLREITSPSNTLRGRFVSRSDRSSVQVRNSCNIVAYNYPFCMQADDDMQLLISLCKT